MSGSSLVAPTSPSISCCRGVMPALSVSVPPLAGSGSVSAGSSSWSAPTLDAVLMPGMTSGSGAGTDHVSPSSICYWISSY